MRIATFGRAAGPGAVMLFSALATATGIYPASAGMRGLALAALPAGQSRIAPPVRLGAPPDGRSSGGVVPLSPGPAVRTGQCRRWRKLAVELGETFAGYSLRTALLRNCASLEPEVGPATWNWPWNAMDKGGTMPPRLHKVLGRWRIRCGTGTARRRCALLHQAVPTIAMRESADEEFEPQSTFSTHFVIDRVGAREVLLWRLSVDRVPNSIDAGKRRVTGVSAGGVAPPGRSLPQTGSRGKVSLEFDPIAGTGRLTLPFTVCVDAGCILEIHAERAGWIATRLAAGIPVAGNLIVDDGPADRFDLPVEGFKSALSELIRLRRAERQVSGR